MLNTRSSNRNIAGFTLIELMIVVVIVSILAAIALPSYRQYVLRANRTVAKSLLVDLAAKQELELTKTGVFSSDFDFYLISAKNPDPAFSGLTNFYVSNSGETQSSLASTSIYKISLSTSTVTKVSGARVIPLFLLTATAVNDQTSDSSCTPLTLNSNGLRGPQGTDCWGR